MLDGRAYVYVDPKTGVEIASDRENLAASNQNTRRSTWDYVAGASGLIALLGLIIYGLGLFVFGIPIARRAPDFATTWYATSLIPRPVVVGHGMTQLLALPVLGSVGLLLYLVGFIYLTVTYGRLKAMFLSKGRRVRFTLYISGFLAITVLMFIFGWLVLGDFFLGVFWAALSLIYFTTLAYRAWPPTKAEQAEREEAGREGGGYFVRTDPFFKSLILLFAVFLLGMFAFRASSLVHYSGPPPLPPVKITVTGQDATDTTLFRGALLSHTEGFWHILDQDGEVVAIPDVDVKTVRISAIYPGGYVAREFEPALSFSISNAWRLSYPETTDELSIEGPEGAQLIFTNPLHVFDPSNLSELKEAPAPENTEKWVSWFQRHPNLNTSEPVPVRVGGASGMRIDVTPSSTPENPPRDVCGVQACVPLYSDIGSFAHTKDRFIIVSVKGDTVVIDVGAPSDKYDEFLPKAQKVLDTVEWKGE